MKTLKQIPERYLDTRDFKTQLDAGIAFFHNPRIISDGKLEGGGNQYADKDGLIQFICGNGLESDPLVAAKMADLKALLISITTVITAYVNRYADAYGEKYKTDPAIWISALNHVPLMGASKADSQQYSRKMRGVEIAGDFINLVLSIAAGEGPALNSFKTFLEKQGGSLRAGLEENKDAYKTITIGVCVEVFKVGEKITYVPKIQQYRVDFTRQNSRWSSSCASYEEIDIHFEYDYVATVLDYESLEKDPDKRKSFEAFIDKCQKAQIEDASTFFNQDFPPKKETPAESAHAKRAV